ncbi:Hypothetical predicted protein [Mytilus galloprovincialis]|uniref:Heat shock 70 kDa protein 12B n=1 Tax=Mytilus galloprovincialis TaxID=29158 RepID=A0A8B6DNI5_MYTGA|nr:Hypothetical predicted protein [Mytilus galloprovincialis]
MADYSAPGEKYVLTGSRRNVECNRNRYQPYSLWSNESNQCQFIKSPCSDEGQIIYRSDSTTDDASCRCDYRRGFDFVIQPKHKCYCKPFKEDCSCYIHNCDNGLYLDSGYNCTHIGTPASYFCSQIAHNGLQLVNQNSTDNYHALDVYYADSHSIPSAIVVMVMVVLVIVGTEKVKDDLVSKQTYNNYTKFTQAKGKDNAKLNRNYLNPGEDYMRLNSSDCDTEKVVVAIDLGTTFSGYAFSSKTSFNEDPLEIEFKKYWESGSGGLISFKTPTSVLLRSDGECLSLGYDAENEYSDRLLDSDDSDCLFFHRFKMNLYNVEDITDKWKIGDINKESMTALHVFSSALAKLKEYAEIHIKKRHPKIAQDAIHWVITVPAIWRDKAKDFMRKSAEKAGIKRHKLLMALEPESVSIYFQYMYKYRKQKIPELSDYDILNCKYLVIDVGGGTVEITTHQAINGILTELCKPSGSNWGSTMIDQKFIKFIENIVGEDFFESFIKQHTTSYFDLLRKLEYLKREIYSDSLKAKTHINFKYPQTLETFYKTKSGKNIAEAITNSPYSHLVFAKTERLQISKTIIQEMFEHVIEKVITNINSVLIDPQSNGVNTFLVVGGFALSPIFKTEMSKAFPNVNIIIPDDADMVVAKGAVLFGHGPNFIVLYDDDGCKLLCEASVKLPTTSTRGKRCIAVDFEFGNTEFKVTAFEKETNKLCEVTCALR